MCAVLHDWSSISTACCFNRSVRMSSRLWWYTGWVFHINWTPSECSLSWLHSNSSKLVSQSTKLVTKATVCWGKKIASARAVTPVHMQSQKLNFWLWSLEVCVCVGVGDSVLSLLLELEEQARHTGEQVEQAGWGNLPEMTRLCCSLWMSRHRTQITSIVHACCTVGPEPSYVAGLFAVEVLTTCM